MGANQDRQLVRHSEERTVELASQTAVWYSTGLFAVPMRWVLIRDPEGRFKPQEALLCLDLDADPEQIVRWFVMRWQLEVTFQESRRHLGFETQRQWSGLAIRRTTPALLGLFSLITLFAHRRLAPSTEAVRGVAWYRKAPDLLGCSSVGTQGFVGTCGFLRVAFGDRHGKSPGGIRGTTNRCGLLRGVNG